MERHLLNLCLDVETEICMRVRSLSLLFVIGLLMGFYAAAQTCEGTQCGDMQDQTVAAGAGAGAPPTGGVGGDQSRGPASDGNGQEGGGGGSGGTGAVH